MEKKMHPIEEELEKLDLHHIYEVMDATDALALLRAHVRRLKLPANAPLQALNDGACASEPTPQA